MSESLPGAVGSKPVPCIAGAAACPAPLADLCSAQSMQALRHFSRSSTSPPGLDRVLSLGQTALETAAKVLKGCASWPGRSRNLTCPAIMLICQAKRQQQRRPAPPRRCRAQARSTLTHWPRTRSAVRSETWHPLVNRARQWPRHRPAAKAGIFASLILQPEQSFCTAQHRLHSCGRLQTTRWPTEGQCSSMASLP